MTVGDVTIINTIDSEKVHEFMTSDEGEQVLLDTIAQNTQEVLNELTRDPNSVSDDMEFKYELEKGWECLNRIEPKDISQKDLNELNELIAHNHEFIVFTKNMLKVLERGQDEAIGFRDAILLENRRMVDALGDMCRQTYCGYLRRLQFGIRTKLINSWIAPTFTKKPSGGMPPSSRFAGIIAGEREKARREKNCAPYCCEEIPEGPKPTPVIFTMRHCKYVEYVAIQQDNPFVNPW